MKRPHIRCAVAVTGLALGASDVAWGKTLDLLVQPGDVRVPRPPAAVVSEATDRGPSPEQLRDSGPLGGPGLPIRRTNDNDEGFLGGLLGGKTIPLFRVTVPGSMFGG